MASFPEKVKQAVFKRQKGLCAHCGMSLNKLLMETAMNSMEFHHVIPQAFGGDHSEDNCVALCTATSRGEKDGCHYRVHADGRYRQGSTAPAEIYRYAHGGAAGMAAHLAWLTRMATKVANAANLSSARRDEART